jgi:hypothetical protein
MKKVQIFGVLLLTILSGSVFCQAAKITGPEATSCTTSGALTSCSISCTGAATANCTSSFGLSSCTCGDSNGKLTVSKKQLKNLSQYIQVLSGLSEKRSGRSISITVTKLVGYAQAGKVRLYAETLNVYKEKIEKLNKADYDKVQSFITRLQNEKATSQHK